MGYKLHITINSAKAVDFSTLGEVNVFVYLEGESFSIVNSTTDSDGYEHSEVDKSTYPADEPGRLKVYFDKTGYKPGCAKINRSGDFLDNNGLKNYSFEVTILLVAETPEIISLTP